MCLAVCVLSSHVNGVVLQLPQRDTVSIPWMVLGINSVADPRTVLAEGPMLLQQTPVPQQRTRRNQIFMLYKA